jgi:hypothetical protein
MRVLTRRSSTDWSRQQEQHRMRRARQSEEHIPSRIGHDHGRKQLGGEQTSHERGAGEQFDIDEPESTYLFVEWLKDCHVFLPSDTKTTV